jgi:hypothetical protein
MAECILGGLSVSNSQKIASGVTSAGSSGGDVVRTISIASYGFTSPPTVVAVPDVQNSYFYVSDVSSTSFTVKMSNYPSKVYWIAIGT